MNSVIQEMIDRHQPKNKVERENAIKEVIR